MKNINSRGIRRLFLIYFYRIILLDESQKYRLPPNPTNFILPKCRFPPNLAEQETFVQGSAETDKLV